MTANAVAVVLEPDVAQVFDSCESVNGRPSNRRVLRTYARRCLPYTIATMIHLIGPGGAGKTTTASALADQLGVSFVDLDAEFAASCGGISTYFDLQGYDTYAAQTVSVYSALTSVAEPLRVVALSSGFMTYRHDVHPSYAGLREGSHRAR